MRPPVRLVPSVPADPFFSSPARQSALAVAAKAWVGTPFIAHGRLRGIGADCVHLISAILADAGFTHLFDPPPYTVQEGMHSPESKLIDYIETHILVLTIPVAEEPALTRLLTGDILCFKMGRSVHHIGLLIAPGRFIHTMPRLGAVIACLHDSTFARRLAAVYRPLCS